MKKDLILKIMSLVQGRNELHYSVPAQDLGVDKGLKILGNAEVELVMLRSGDKLLIDGKVKFRADSICSICAEPFIKEYTEPIHVEYLKQNLKLGRSVLLTSDEVDRAYYQGETIDLSPLIHDTILLAIPLAPSCREDCKGICSGCGANLNFEPCQCEEAAIKKV